MRHFQVGQVVRRTIQELGGTMPEQLPNPEKSIKELEAQERKRLRQWLKNFRLPVTGHRPIDEAIVTAGGVDTKEVDPRTMESRLVRGLYFAGEVLDLQADTGGYNLQAAFSTGHLAAMSAIKELS